MTITIQKFNLLLRTFLWSHCIYFLLTSVANANPITEENANVGSRGWVLSTDDSGHAADDVTGQIKGYVSATSVNKGEQIDFKVSVNSAQNFTIEIYRAGWYGGEGGRLMTSIGPLAGFTQPACPKDTSTGMVECNWTTSHSLTIPSNWTSGIYLVKFKNAEGYDSGTLFAVRDDSRTADFLYQLPVATYLAYNLYPDGSGGNSLYGTANETQAVKVSFNRPYADYKSSSNGYGDFTYFDLPLVKWLEKMGYDVAYSTDIDTHIHGERLLNYKSFISSGHDEYWSKEMRDAVETARSNRVNLAVFGSNVAYWQVRFEPATDGTPNRTMVSYKENAAALDPIADPALKTDLFRSASVNRPEQTLLGVQFITFSNLYSSTAFSNLVVKNTSHWIYRNSGLIDGQTIPGLVGYEIDTIFPGIDNQASASEFNILAESPYTNVYGKLYTQHTVLYRTPYNGWVFASGTMVWSWALDNDIQESNYFGDRRSSAIQTVTKNLLDHFSDHTPPSISINQPNNNTEVSGSTPVHAHATDSTGMAGVQFQLDGINLGAMDSTPPYTLTWDSTSTNNGNHVLTAIAKDEAGNLSTSAPVTITVNNVTLPDVVVTALTYADGKFTSVVKNQGNAPVPSNVYIGVGYSVDGIYRTWGMAKGPLAAGESVTIGTNGQNYSMPSGTHTLSAYVDDINRFQESNETNNQFSTEITNLMLPDVVVTSVSYADGVFTSVVTNQGAAATPEGVTIGVDYSVDGISRTWGAIKGPLAAGASVTIGTHGGNYLIPSGTHTFSATADDVNRFAENNESNNQLMQSITLP